MQTTVQKPDAIRLWSGILSVWNGTEYLNLGALKNAVLSVTKLISEMVFDNAKMSPKSKIQDALLSADLYEIDLENLQLIDGFADYSTLDGTPVVITDEALKVSGETWADGEVIPLANANGDGSAITVTALTNNGVTVATSYEVFVENGVTKLLNISGGDIAITGTGLEVDYTYTPNASKTQLYKDVMKELSKNKFKFVNTNDEGKIFSIEFFSGYNRGNLEITFQSDETTDDASFTPIEIKAFPDANQQLFQIVDEQSLI